MSIKNIHHKAEFEQAISHGYSIVDFYATWCGPCKMLSPVLEKVSTIASDINFFKIDIDQESTIANQLSIRSVPTVFFFKDGKPIDQFVGYKPEQEILEFIKRNK